ncbi:MAG: hypothetical protein HYZ47_00985 [Simkania negevensis]|nr:hypothetical protein [Simkania negevensis]
MGSWSTEKKYLSASGLLAIIRKAFSKIKEPSPSIKEGRIPLVDCLMSGLALFGLKFPSLLRFDQSKEDEIIKHNLATLYGVEKVPCDTYMRERLDLINPYYLRRTFCKLFAHLQRGKVLEDYLFLVRWNRSLLLRHCPLCQLLQEKSLRWKIDLLPSHFSWLYRTS